MTEDSSMKAFLDYILADLSSVEDTKVTVVGFREEKRVTLRLRTVCQESEELRQAN